MNKFTFRQVILLLAFVLVLPSYSQDKARRVAEQFLSQKMSNPVQHIDSIGNRQTSQRPSYELVYEKKEVGKSLLYVFSCKEQKQFAIVTASEEDPFIIGYSLNQSFEKDNIIPPVKAFIDAYAQAAKDGMPVRKADVTEKAPIWPLVKTKWGQDYPYNLYAPADEAAFSGRMPVGCGPLAMGQIMKYYEYPTCGTGEHGGVNFAEQTYDFSKMIEGHASESSANEVAKLLRHAGIACDAVYDWFGTGSTALANIDAMCKYFGYNSQATAEFRMNMTDEEWDALIYNELANRHPVIYSGFPDGGDGHTFIVDGYNEGYYHVNWGWNGAQDGYFLFNAMLNYNDSQLASIGLYPKGWTPKEEEISELKTVGLCDNTISQLASPYGNDGENTAVSNIPYSHLAAYTGMKIVGVQIGLAEEATGIEVRLKSNLLGTPFFKQEVGNGHAGWNTFLFDAPVEIPATTIFTEYAFDPKPGAHPVGVSADDLGNAMYEKDAVDVDMWYSDGAGFNFGSTRLAFRLILSEDTEMPADLRILNMEQAIVLSGTHIKTTGIIENTSCHPISNYTLKYKIDDNPVQTRLVNQSLKYGERTFFSLDIEDEFVPGSHELRVWVGEVDGQPDAVFANSNYYVTTPLTFNIAGDKSFPRTHVAMANVDAYCPFSYVYNEVQETVEKSGIYDCIFINNHIQCMGPDPMADVVGTKGGGSTPNLYVNGIHYDNYESLSYLISSYDQTSLAKIEGKASFTADKKQIIVNTTTSFAYPGNNNYRIDYVLVDENYGPFEEVGDDVFNHVTRGIYHTSNGVVTTPYSPDMPQACCYAIPLLENVHDTDNLHVVAMLIDDKSGEIVNAVDLNITDSDAPVFVLDKPNLSLLCDVTEKLNVIDSDVSNENAEDYVFTSSNENVVKILENGFIRAVGVGEAVITCESKNGSGTAKCNVTVRDWANVITVETPGTLHNLVGLLDYKELKINGRIDAMDMRYIRALTGGVDDYSLDMYGSVRHLNLKDAIIIEDERNVTPSQDWGYVQERGNNFPARMFMNSPISVLVCPSTLRTMDDLALAYSRLRNLTIYEGLAMMCGDQQMNLSSVYLPSTLSDPITDRSQIDNYWIDSRNPYFMVYNNDLYTKNSKKLIYYSNCGRYELALPDWCTAVEDYLTYQEWGTTGFVGRGVVNLGPYFIARKWRKAVFGPRLKKVHQYFLSDAENIKYIVMPPLTPPTLENLWSPWVNTSDIILYVNPESIELYKAHPEWSKFFIQPMTQEMLDEVVYPEEPDMFKVSYFVGEELVHQDEVAFGETFDLWTYKADDGWTFNGWIGEKYETMPAHDISYIADITSGIAYIINNQETVQGIYTLDGKKVEKINHGVYVIRMKDGSTRKFIAK